MDHRVIGCTAHSNIGIATSLDLRGDRRSTLADLLVAAQVRAGHRAPHDILISASLDRSVADATAIVNVQSAAAVDRRNAGDGATEAALTAFEASEWGQRYPALGQSWRRVWGEVAPFFAFPQAVRRIIYTTQSSR